MAIEEIKADEVQTSGRQISEDERLDVIKIDAGQKIANITLNTFRKGVSDYGAYLNVFFTDHDEDVDKIFRVNLPEDREISVWDKQFLETFTYKDDETGYYMLKDRFVNKTVWLGKVQPEGKKYRVIVWGFEESPAEPTGEPQESNESTGIDGDTDYSNQQGTAGYYLQTMYDNGADQFVTAKKLVDELGYTTSDAMEATSNYYKTRQ